MKQYSKDNNDRKNNRRPKRRTPHKFLKKVLLIGCLISFVILAIALVKNELYFNEREQSSIYFLNNVEENVEDNLKNDIDLNDYQEEEKWSLILVNKWNSFSDDYKVELAELEGGQMVDARINPALQEMLAAANSHNIYPVVVSGYRTRVHQQRLMDEKITAYISDGYLREDAIRKAEAWVALPGTSEHELGIAVDINGDGIFSTGEEVYKWLKENSYKYGFIYRYPEDKTEITGVINEPWHYRYVGINAAKDIYNQKICLEEYLGRVN